MPIEDYNVEERVRGNRVSHVTLYRARDRRTDLTHFLKRARNVEMGNQLIEREQAFLRLIQQAPLAERDAIGELFEAGIDDDRLCWTVIDPGFPLTLDELVKEEHQKPKKDPTKEILPWVAQSIAIYKGILTAGDQAYQAGVDVNRVSLEAIAVDPYMGKVKLIDFKYASSRRDGGAPTTSTYAHNATELFFFMLTGRELKDVKGVERGRALDDAVFNHLSAKKTIPQLLDEILNIAGREGEDANIHDEVLPLIEKLEKEFSAYWKPEEQDVAYKTLKERDSMFAKFRAYLEKMAQEYRGLRMQHDQLQSAYEEAQRALKRKDAEFAQKDVEFARRAAEYDALAREHAELTANAVSWKTGADIYSKINGPYHALKEMAETHVMISKKYIPITGVIVVGAIAAVMYLLGNSMGNMIKDVYHVLKD